MKISSTHDPLPVLLLYNINPDWPPEDIEASNSAAQDFQKKLQDEGHPVSVACLENNDLQALLKPYAPDEYIVFNWCEEIPGTPHSYDLIARTLEGLGFTFTGADSKALSFSQDKRLVKQRLEACNISTPRWGIFSRPAADGWDRFPAIVKPALEHCSYGVNREAVVWDPAGLETRIRYVMETFQQPALVEEFIDGREFHVTVVGNGRLDMFPPAEMDFSAFEEASDRLCSYASKYDPSSRDYNLIKLQLPAPLTRDGKRDLKKIAIEAFRAVDCRDYARLDIRLREGVFYVLDVNPNADISADTSLALSAEKAGLSHGKLGSLLVHLASLRHPAYGARAGKTHRAVKPDRLQELPAQESPGWSPAAG